MVFNFTGNIVFGYEHEKSSPESMCGMFKNFTKAMISFPVNIPGTTFYQVMKVRMYLINTI